MWWLTLNHLQTLKVFITVENPSTRNFCRTPWRTDTSTSKLLILYTRIPKIEVLPTIGEWTFDRKDIGDRHLSLLQPSSCLEIYIL